MDTELIWQHLDTAGWEHVRVMTDHPGWNVFDSILVRSHEGQVLRGGYTLVTDKEWRTLEVRVMIESTPGSMGGIQLLTEGDGKWTDAEEKPIPELDGCLDVDISWSPLSASLPINRLEMKQGERNDLKSVHISLPDLTMQVIDQVYLRESDSTVVYDSTLSSAAVSLQVDGNGIVTNYPDRFMRTWPE